MTYLEVKNLSKSFDTPIVNDVSFGLEKSKTLCLLGPSGSGKTTLLRLIAGLEKPDCGHIYLNAKEITHIPSHKRKLGLMFQDFALFPHKTVAQNIAFGLEMQNQKPKMIKEKTRDILDLVKLSAYAIRDVAALSGGERQRVALARSLAPQPKLLMLDEPLGSLDRALRENLMTDIQKILKNLDITTIFVTHDQAEALAVADTIGVMNKGALVQLATPQQLYRQPQTVFVARFMGFENIIPGTITPEKGVSTSLGIFYPPHIIEAPGKNVHLVIRPESASIGKKNENQHRMSQVTGTIISRIFKGSIFRIKLSTTPSLNSNSNSNLELSLDIPSDLGSIDVGKKISLWILHDKMSVIYA